MKEYKRNLKCENEYILMKEKIIIKIFKQLLSTAKYLHNKFIIYRDIKPDNR